MTKHPYNLDEAISVILEIESYLVSSSLLSTHASVSELLILKVVAGVCESQETMMQMLSKIMERLNKLELKQATYQSHNSTH